MLTAFSRMTAVPAAAAPGAPGAPVKMKRSALLAATTTATAAAPVPELTRTAVAEETGMDLTALHTYLESWLAWVETILTKNDAAEIYATSPGLDIETHILFQVDNNDKKKKKRMERLKMIPWIGAALLPWTEGSKDAFKKLVMEFAWDEELMPNEQKQLLTEVPTHPIIKQIASQHFLESGSVSAVRYLNMISLKMEYLCRGADGSLAPCAPTVISVITREKYDPLKLLTVNKDTTGTLYGFLVPKGEDIVFKTGVPPAAGGKIGRGQECANVSTTTEHLNKLIAMGEVLVGVAGQDLGLTTAQMLDVRNKQKYLANTNMMCALLGLVLRYMDAMRLQDRRWFYRTVAANITGHLGR
jgi:hypothetical protein